MSASAARAVTVPSYPLTVQQQAYVDDFAPGRTGHSALRARAGCGKTSTILAAVDYIYHTFPRAETAVYAFNRAIADEVSVKLLERGLDDWKRVKASTLHSAGWDLVRFVFRLEKKDIDDKKVRKLIAAAALLNPNDPGAAPRWVFETYGTQIEALVRYAKDAGIGFFPDSPIGDVGVWHQLADHFDVNGLEDTSESDAVVAGAQEIYRASLNQTTVVDFADMILWPLIKNIRVKFTKDFVFLDEGQDLSRVKQALARKFVKPGTGRLSVVGDDKQAIYGFSGADSAALPNLIRDLSATVFPLSVTWRCPKAVVAVAQTFVPDIEAAPSAPEGEVLEMDQLPEDVSVEDAILCRNMAPLVEIAYKLIRAGKPAKVEGRSIGDGLVALARRWKVRTIDAFLNRLEEYQAREVQKALAKGNESKAEEVEDRCETLRQIAKACLLKGLTSVDDIVAFIEGLFADGVTNATTLATYHRSKGREWGRVFLYQHAARCPSKRAKQDWELEQEDNLAYVAVTRAQRTLVWLG